MPLPESRLIAGIRRRVKPSGSVVEGIGDDAAVLRVPRGHEVLVTTDCSLERVHFDRRWHTPEVVGHRCLTRGLSDIAAMGGIPRAAFLSLAVRRDLSQSWIDRFFSGFLALARRHAVSLAGGDTAASRGGVLADIVVVGSVPRGKAVRRSGARPGDWIYVSGSLGGAAAGLEWLRQAGKATPRQAQAYPAHFSPCPRLKLGRTLRERWKVSAMIDISDGLSTDLGHLCHESDTGADIWAEAIPLARAGRPARTVQLETALHGGEDYELLFTAPIRLPRKIAGIPVTAIGRMTKLRGMRLTGREGSGALKPGGWEHFRRR